jgi:hypothetical protein
LFGEEVNQLCQKSGETIIHLQKLEQLVSLSDLDDVPKIMDLLDSLHNIEFSYFENNADVLGYCYQRIGFIRIAPKDKLDDKSYEIIMGAYKLFEMNYKEYGEKNKMVEKHQEQRGILLLHYITAFNQRFYQTCNPETRENLKSIGEKITSTSNSTMYYYMNFTVHALDFLHHYDKYSQEKKHALAKGLLKRLNEAKNGDDKTAFKFLVKDSMEYLVNNLSDKLEKTDESKYLVTRFENLLKSIGPYQKGESHQRLGDSRHSKFSQPRGETNHQRNSVENTENTKPVSSTL